MDIGKIKANYGDKLTLIGNIDSTNTLIRGTKEEIKRQTKNIIGKGSLGGGYILSSNNTIYSAVPTENFLTIIEAAKKYGKYPIAHQWSDLNTL